MIALSRADVRRFRLAARRCAPNGRSRGPAPPVRLTADGGTVTLAANLGEVVIALRTTPPRPSNGSLTLPLTELEQLEGTGPGVVTLARAGRSAATARWEDGPAPRTASIECLTCELAWPEEPAHLIAMSPTFPAALHEAGRSAAREGTRYAGHRVQVRGKAGQLVGTDGKQALVHGGFTFPFTDDLLVPAVPVFGSKDLSTEQAVSVGLVDGWLFLVVGPWHVWLAVDRDGRFPDVVGAVPRACGIRVEFDDRDADTLMHSLRDLPGAREDCQPVTLDLGPLVAVRARDERTGEVGEVPLAHTQFAGGPVRLVLNRAHLGRALALGFREFRCRAPDQPVVARAGERLYLTASLDPSGAVPPAGDALASALPPTTTVSPAMPSPETPRSPTMPARDNPLPERNGHAESPADSIDLLVEAEALRNALGEAVNRAARLVAALRVYRKERRALASAFSSLRQLNLGP